MEIGVVGKPNVGKSTFFSAATLAPAQIANYPFTTIEPNRGVAYVRTKCPHVELGVQCNPNNSPCKDGVRLVPVEMIDVAGLVPGAHEGKGLGNKFLDDLRQASSLIHVIDVSGGTTEDGTPTKPGTRDPALDSKFLEDEISFWIKGILDKDWRRLSKQAELDGARIERVLHERFTGLGFTEPQIQAALRKAALGPRPSVWTEDELVGLARSLQKSGKPMLLAANKYDMAADGAVEKLRSAVEGQVVATSAEFELALRRAAQAGLIDYLPGAADFKVIEPSKLSDKQAKALEQIRHQMRKHGGTGVQKCIETSIFETLNLMVVYPVEDENKYTDKQGRVLPDAHLVPKGCTARELAYRVHTDLGENFIRAVDARTKRVIGQDHQLKDGDVVTIYARR
ncbi:MAG: redox-regulated ATPase YchF [Methanobacteriota archaeon]